MSKLTRLWLAIRLAGGRVASMELPKVGDLVIASVYGETHVWTVTELDPGDTKFPFRASSGDPWAHMCWVHQSEWRPATPEELAKHQLDLARQLEGL